MTQPGDAKLQERLRAGAGLVSVPLESNAVKLWTALVLAMSVGTATKSLAATVGFIEIKGAIGPATATYIARAIDVAAKRNDACLIIQLDTPGGLLDSTKDIVQKFY